MSDFAQFLGGGSGAAVPIYREIFSAARTWVAPVSGRLYFFGTGGGGSGGVYGGTGGVATGGGAAEFAIEPGIRVAAGDSYTFTPGAAGARIVGSLGAAGNAGSDSTVTGPSGYSLTIKGGGPGGFSDSAAVSGGTGGTGGTGGSSRIIRYAGGRGGDSTFTASSLRATGGGGANILCRTAQTATRGGDITGSATGAIATGGGSPHAPGVDLTSAMASAGGEALFAGMSVGVWWGLNIFETAAAPQTAGASVANSGFGAGGSAGVAGSTGGASRMFGGGGATARAGSAANGAATTFYGGGGGAGVAGADASYGSSAQSGLFMLVFTPD